MSVAVFALVMNGSSLIEKVLSLWSFVLYGVYILFLILVFANFSGQIGHNIASVPVTGNWAIGGFQYSFYNLRLSLRFCIPLNIVIHQRMQRLPVFFPALLVILPGIILFIAMCGFYPTIIEPGAAG